MKEKRVDSICRVDLSGLFIPQIAVYQHPEDFPEECVARIYDNGQATDVVIVKKTVSEIQTDIKKHAPDMIFIPRRPEDVLSLAGVWMQEGTYGKAVYKVHRTRFLQR